MALYEVGRDREDRDETTVFGRCHSRAGRAYIGTRPSKKRIARVCEAISEMTSRRWLPLDAEERVGLLNRMLVEQIEKQKNLAIANAASDPSAIARYRELDERWRQLKQAIIGPA